MAQQSKSANAGVHNSIGIEFQKHCALYMLFEKYAAIENRRYFICIEHHDDFLFCFQTQADLIESIEAYQAKKSSSQWGMGVELSEILTKITQAGLDLHADPHPKDAAYSHTLSFVTNNSIQLSCGKRKGGQTELINDSNSQVRYLDLHADIQANILKGLTKKGGTNPNHIKELDKVSLAYIDLPKKLAGQKDNLVGQFKRIFGSRVNDPIAAVDVLISLFRGVETVLNNGQVARLMDKSKRVDSVAIKEAMRIITTKAKAYEFWRQKGDELANKIVVSVFERDRFKLQFENSFDLFKDLKQTEHQKLLKYVLNHKGRWAAHTDEIVCINDIYTSFIAENSTNLLDLDIKAAVCAAYLELRG